MSNVAYQNSPLLLQDVFTFLAYTHQYAPKMIGTRSLSPRAVQQINSLLCVRDAINAAHPHTARGQWKENEHVKKSERHTTRLRFIHYLAESANLVAVSGSRLIPTLRAIEWLDALPYERAKILFDAAFPQKPTRADHERWLAYEMPELAVNGKQPLAAWLTDILFQTQPTATLKFTTLLKLFHDAQTNNIFHAYESENPAHAPDVLLRDLLDLLQQFDVITWKNASTLQITSLGDALLGHDSIFVSMPRANFEPLTWSKSAKRSTLPDLIASAQVDSKQLWRLNAYADHIATLASQRINRRLYRLDSEKIRRALDTGESVADIIEFLETVTADALPVSVAAMLHTLADAYGKIVLRRAVLLETDEPALLQTLTRQKTVRACIQRTLSARAVVVKPQRALALARRLKQRGFQPRLELETFSQKETFPQKETFHRNVSTAPFENETRAHLYLAAQIAVQISARVPDAYKFPAALVSKLQEKIADADREVASQLARELVNAFAEKQKSRSTTRARIAERDFAPAADQVSVNLAAIQRALETSARLHITYYSPYRDETTRRVIEPLRLQEHDDCDYLIAYCHLDRDERTFRVDRILEIKSEGRGMKDEQVA